MAEFGALRATIRERGTARVVIFALGLGFWSILVVVIFTWPSVSTVSLVSLLLLAASFEAVNALHVGVERVGRYVQVRYEAPAAAATSESAPAARVGVGPHANLEMTRGAAASGGGAPRAVRNDGGAAGLPEWETAAMKYGQLFRGAGTDPLFSLVFTLATIVNFLSVSLISTRVELLALGALHLALPIRILLARRRAARQRAEDLARFHEILSGPSA